MRDSSGRGRSASWIDYDRDGDLDLFRGNTTSETGPDRLFRNNGNGKFTDVTDQSGINETKATLGNVWSDYDDDGDMDLVVSGGTRMAIYRNNGNGKFSEVTSDVTGKSAKSHHGCWAADFGDYDNDGDMDLYVACGNSAYFDHIESSSSVIDYMFSAPKEEDGIDFRSSATVTFHTLKGGGPPMPKKKIFIGANSQNPGSVPFTLGSSSSHCGKPSYTPGKEDALYIWQDCPGGSWHFRANNNRNFQGQLTTKGAFSNVRGFDIEESNPPKRTNRLYQNRGDGTFKEVGGAAGVNSNHDSYDATWGDFNNDGLLDIYVVNSGNVETGNIANHLYRNNGDGTFTDVAGTAGVAAVTPGLGSCATWADYDHNGFLDLFVVTDGIKGFYAGPHKLYRNKGNNHHWLAINLRGKTSNRYGIGSKVEVKAGGVTQTRNLNNGSHYFCQNESTLHFGLGSASAVQSVTVTWPTGQSEVISNVAVDQILLITEGSGATQPPATPESTPTPPAIATATPTNSPTPSSGQITLEVRVNSSRDDAEERISNGRVSTGNADLELIRDGSNDQVVGIRFRKVAIPKNADITYAYIEFETDEKASGATSLTFHGQAADSAGSFKFCSSDCFDISNRARTTAAVNWDNIPAWNKINEKHQTPNLAAIVQEIVDRSGWSSRNNMAFFVSGSGKRVAESFNGEAGAAPLLHVEYTTGASPPPAGTPTPSPTAVPNPNGEIIEVRVSDGKDDAEELVSNGNVRAGSNDLELIQDKTGNQVVGLRFTNVNVPKNATISQANITFETDETNSEPTSLTFHGEANDNPGSMKFCDGCFGISSRPRTTSAVDWTNLAAWNAVNETHLTPDLASIVQEIVDREGWSSGNSMVFIISGSGKRVAEAYNGEKAAAPLLRIEYTADTSLAKQNANVGYSLHLPLILR